MLRGVLSRLAPVRVSVGYAVMLVGVATALVILGPQVQDQVIRLASTNLHNLAHGHLATLLCSAFVTDCGPIYIWLPGLVSLLALAELMWRSGRLVVAFLVGHIGATLLVAVALTAALRFGWLPTSVTRATDVGMSYGAVAVLGALTGAIPRRWRPVWIGWWLAVGTAGLLLSGRDFADVGHGFALLLGMVVSTRFGVPERWTKPRMALLVIAAAFGFLMLASSGLAMVAALGLGAPAALVANRRARRPRVSREVVATEAPASEQRPARQT
jgi:hypothetical protein